MKKIIIAIIVIIILGVAYWLISPLFRVVKLNEGLPTVNTPSTSTPETPPAAPTPVVLREAPMLPHDHDVEGKASIIKLGTATYLRFENLKTVNGPDLHVYLSADLENKDSIHLSKIKATEGSVNYLLPEGIDISKYNNALLWCRAFNVLFSYAKL